MTHQMLENVWTHIVPIAFLIGSVVLISTSAAKILFGDFPTIMTPGVGIIVGSLYILLGGAYEWTIQQEKKTEQWYKKQKELLDHLESQEEQ